MSTLAEPIEYHDGKVIGLVGVAHFFSHFYQLVLPPLFVLLGSAYHVDFAALGSMMMLFSAASGLSQTPAGFLVDRFGANRVLPAGLALEAGSILLIGLAQSFWLTLPLAALAGIGNSVFHPADYAILSSRVRPARIGRAYSIHTVGGSLGWAAAPAVMLPLATVLGFHLALVMVGIVGLLVAAMLVVGRSNLEVPVRRKATGPQPSSLALFASRPIVMCFVYFTLLALSSSGIQTFMPTGLVKLHGLSLGAAATALSVYIMANAAGALAGGWVADRTSSHEEIIAVGLALAGAAILLVGEVDLAAPLLLATLAVAGFLAGITTPSRDMLVRKSTPPGSTGRVFGFVYSGLDLGSAIAPPVLGFVLDGGHPLLVFQLLAGSLAVTIFSALILKGQAPAPAPLAAD